MTVNVAGCFLIGLFCAAADKGNLLTPDVQCGFCDRFYSLPKRLLPKNINPLHCGDLMLLYTSASIIPG